MLRGRSCSLPIGGVGSFAESLLEGRGDKALVVDVDANQLHTKGLQEGQRTRVGGVLRVE